MSTISQATITIVIADDHAVARAGIRKTLEAVPEFRIVGEAEDGEQVKARVADLRPNILVLDLIMPNTKPSDLERWVRTNYPETNTLV